jgi:hypothetical protein
VRARAAAGMHQDGTAAELGAGRGHGWVPEVSADVVDDLCAGFDGQAGSLGVEGVDRQDGFGAGAEDCAEHGQDACLLFRRGDGRGGGPCGLAAKVEEVGAVIEHFEGAGEAGSGREELAAVGEGVGREVEDAHDQGSRAELEGPGAKAPGKARASDRVHITSENS